MPLRTSLRASTPDEIPPLTPQRPTPRAQGDIDLFVCNNGVANGLYSNGGASASYALAAADASTAGEVVTDAYSTIAAAWGDYDGDVPRARMGRGLTACAL